MCVRGGGCTPERRGDGHCDQECMSAECDFDWGDCEVPETVQEDADPQEHRCLMEQFAGAAYEKATIDAEA